MSLPKIRLRRPLWGRIILLSFYSSALAFFTVALISDFRPDFFAEPKRLPARAAEPKVPMAASPAAKQESPEERGPQADSLGWLVKEPVEKEKPPIPAKPPEPPKPPKPREFRLWRLILYDGSNPFRPFRRRSLEPDPGKKELPRAALKLPAPEGDLFDEKPGEEPAALAGAQEGQPILMGRSAQAQSVTESRQRKGLAPEEYRALAWREEQAFQEAERKMFWRRFSFGAVLSFLFFIAMLIFSGLLSAVREIEAPSQQP